MLDVPPASGFVWMLMLTILAHSPGKRFAR